MQIYCQNQGTNQEHICIYIIDFYNLYLTLRDSAHIPLKCFQGQKEGTGKIWGQNIWGNEEEGKKEGTTRMHLQKRLGYKCSLESKIKQDSFSLQTGHERRATIYQDSGSSHKCQVAHRLSLLLLEGHGNRPLQPLFLVLSIPRHAGNHLWVI